MIKTNRYDFPLESAIEAAKSASDRYGIAQTVFRHTDSCGWFNTNPFASFRGIAESECHVTILPSNYFD